MLPLYSVNKLFSDNQSDNKPAMAQRLMLTPILLLALVLPLPGYAGDGHDHARNQGHDQGFYQGFYLCVMRVSLKL